MVKGSIVLVAAAGAAVFSLMQSPAFMPPAGRPVQVPMATLGALASFCAAMPAVRAATAVEVLDPVDEAAKRLADACYPIFEDIDWVRAPAVTKWLATSSQYGQPPLRLAEFADKMLELGISMDQELVIKAVQAHEKALGHGMRTAKLLAPISDVETIFIALARMLKSAPQDQIQAVHDSAINLGVDTFKTDAFLGLGTVGPGALGLQQAEVDRAYALFLELGNLVKDR